MNDTDSLTRSAPVRGAPWTQIGTAAYIVWGILHLGLGIAMVTPMVGSGVTTEQDAESLMFFVCAIVFGIQSVAVAWFLGRNNNLFGYWLNLLALGVIDAVFVAVMVLPGHIDFIGGLSGPTIWVVAAVTSTVGILRAQRA